MNSVAIPNASSAAFVSDIHLSDNDPDTEILFFGFLRRLRSRRPACLFILGDLFEYWPGDDDLGEPLAARVIEQLRVLAAAGIRLYFMAGNRDFLVEEKFAKASGASILADPTVVQLGHRTFLISHGDALCIDDEAYQQYRARVRSPEWRQSFLEKSLAERRSMIVGLRSASELAKKTKSSEMMDVSAQAVTDLFRQTKQPLLIHGHTHRPGRHDLQIDGLSYERWVLPDWDAHATPPRGGGIFLDANDVVLMGVGDSQGLEGR